MQHLSACLHGTLGFYLRDALREGSVDAVACLLVPRVYVFSSFILFTLWSPLLFLLFFVKSVCPYVGVSRMHYMVRTI
jgi:hypothetical protein